MVGFFNTTTFSFLLLIIDISGSPAALGVSPSECVVYPITALWYAYLISSFLVTLVRSVMIALMVMVAYVPHSYFLFPFYVHVDHIY